jgi:peptide methionine sulfoxide reductase msrA/msrB
MATDGIGHSASNGKDHMKADLRTRVFTVLAVVGVGSALFAATAPRKATLMAKDTKETTEKSPAKPISDAEKAERLKQLTPLQVHVTQECGTEPPFHNAYWDNHRPGIYVDVVSGEPLFLSKDKYDSGTGWPSFTRPVGPGHLQTQTDSSLFDTRVEVRSARAGSHLGHVFDDGPAPTGKRYCMNSASLRFVPAEQMAAEGYGQYLPQLGLPEPVPAPTSRPTRAVATLAGGCFWGVQELIRALPGVLDSKVGYTGGTTDHPDYEQVHTGRTGHAEAVEITFDPTVISYESILRYFFRLHDPTTANRQGNDVGTQYRSAIFYHDDEQRGIAEKVKAEVDASGKWRSKVTTQIVPASSFYLAEDYHQDYLQKNPGGYTCHYLRD